MIKLDKSLAVRRITPADGHYFFGYYDIQPFSANGKYHLVHKTDFRNRLQVQGDKCEIGMIDTTSGKYEKLCETKAWNFQQGAMLQWNPKAPDEQIIYNDLVEGEHVGVVMNVMTGEKRYLERAVANVSRDGKYALSINMSRLYDFRPGYGYAEPADSFYYRKHSENDGVFVINMETGKAELVLSMQEIWDFSGSFFSNDEKIIINHITFNPDASRFLMLVRNFAPKGKRHDTAIITANRDGSDMYLLSDYGVQSHYYWMNNKNVIFYSDGKELACSRGWANNYVLTDKTQDGYILADGYFWYDNHMSFTPDGKYMLADSYPDAEYNMQKLGIYNAEKNMYAEIGKFYSLPAATTDVRCDLHPRWSRDGNKITFDSTHEGFRGVYQIEVPEEVKKTLFEE